MANYNDLKTGINAVIKTNGRQEISGAALNTALNNMITELGAGYQYKGVATPTNPGSVQTPDYKCFYIATTPGTYTNLGGLVVADGEVAILKYDSSWTKEVTGIATAESVSQLGQDVNNILYQFTKEDVAAYTNTGFPFTIPAGTRIENNGTIPLICAVNNQYEGRIDLLPNSYVVTTTDIGYIQTANIAGDVSLLLLNKALDNMADGILSKVSINYCNLFNPNDSNVEIGRYLNPDGTTGTGSYNTSGYIPVEPNTDYYVRKGGKWARFVNFYTLNGNNTIQYTVISQVTIKRKFTTPANCNAIRVSFYQDDYVEAQITKGDEYDYVPYSPILGYLFESQYSNDKIPIKKVGKNRFNSNGWGIETNKFLDVYGHISSGNNYIITPYIPFRNGKMIASVNGVPVIGSAAAICYYDIEYNFISGHSITSTNGVAEWVNGVYYVRFSIPNGVGNLDKIQIEEGEVATGYVPYGFFIPNTDIQPEKQPTLFQSQRDTATITAGDSFELPLIYCRYAQTLSAVISGEIGDGENVEVGRGLNVYAGGSIQLTQTQIIVENTAYNHGLTLTSRSIICLTTNQKGEGKVILITSDGGKFEQNVTTLIGGAAYVKNNTANSIDVDLSLELKKVDEKIWIFGDSYCSLGTTRWPYYVISEWGFETFLMDNLPGGRADQAWQSLTDLIKIGTPKYIVWCLGMNGGTDSNGAVNSSWMAYTKYLISLCIGLGITPVFATIPSVPDMPHEKLNNWVRNSGYRYIDFAKAVNAQPDGTWTTGLLRSDNIHPTEAGAKVLASQVLIDFPEITID